MGLSFVGIPDVFSIIPSRDQQKNPVLSNGILVKFLILLLDEFKQTGLALVRISNKVIMTSCQN